MKNKLELVAEAYTYYDRVRSWGAVQENDNSPSAYYTTSETRYRVRNGDVILTDDLYSMKKAKEMANIYSHTSSEIRLHKKIIRAQFLSDLKKLKELCEIELNKWEANKLKRRELIEKGKPLKKLEDLTGTMPLIDVLSDLVIERKRKK